MPQRQVRDLMRQDGSQLVLVLQQVEQSNAHAKPSARQQEGDWFVSFKDGDLPVVARDCRLPGIQQADGNAANLAVEERIA